MHKQLIDLIGNLPSESGFIKKMRFHQSWWRAFVLSEEQGAYPNRKGDVIGSTINSGETSGKNFLTGNARKAVDLTIEARERVSAGMMEMGRLFNNLLSSQPLCFNFFGDLKADLDFALKVMQLFYPALSKVTEVCFEFAPKNNYTKDRSAFDIALKVEIDGKKGLVGLECKFTEAFSQKEYDKPAYQETFGKSDVFKKEYSTYTASRYNQLFRNQLMAESMVQHNDYDFVYTALFCHQDDESATKIGAEFAALLDLDVDFQIITFKDFVEKVQQLELTWEQREWTMLLWARYCSTMLSENIEKGS